MVSLDWVTTGGFAILAAICVCVFLGMRRMPSLAWLTATAIVATFQTMFLSVAQDLTIAAIAVSVLTPAGYICYSQSIRAALGQRDQNWWLYGMVGALVLIGSGLKLMDVSFLVRLPVFQLCCALALYDSVERLVRYRSRGLIENALIGVIGSVMAVFLFRAFCYPLIFAVDTTYAELRAGPIETATLILSAVLSAVALLLVLAWIINDVIVKYRQRSECDSLTGLLNHQAFHQLGGTAGKAGGSVVVCDIDHFKTVNDRFGHLAGDKALRAFADLLRLSGYQAGRVGGEEFAVIMPGLSADEAAGEADRVRHDYGQMRHADMPTDWRISASFGVAEFGAGENPQAAFARADAALYEAKKAGRNRVVQASRAKPATNAASRAA